MGELFSKITVQRKDLYPSLINQMIAAGWVKLNALHATAEYCDVMQAPSSQSGNNKQIWMLAPFDGTDAFNVPAYDIRKTVYTNAIICYCSAYNSTSGLGVPIKGASLPGAWENFSLLVNTQRRGSSPTAGYARSTPMEVSIDLYFNIGAEYVAFGTIPQSPVLAKNQGCFTYFGRPEDCYLEESSGVAPYVVHGSTGHSSNTSTNIPMFYSRPRNFKPDSASKYSGTCYFVDFGASPNIDGVYTLSDIYMGRVDEGARFRLGNGFMYLGASPELTSGDLIEVSVDGVTKLYVYINHAMPSVSEQGIPTNTFALRIQ